MKEFDFSSENIIKTIEDDYFNRNLRAINLIDIIHNAEDCTALAINASWGSGKTVFVNQLKEFIINKDLYEEVCKKNNCIPKDLGNISVFYFNAWEKNLVNNPAINLLKSIIEDTDIDIEQDGKWKKIFGQLSNIGIKIASKGTLELADFIKDKNEDAFLSVEKVKETFKEAVRGLKQSLGKDKIVIIIDELDRCRPVYAVEMLENLKHFYNEEGIIFVVSTDICQLTHTIKKLYGDLFDADLYLQRFFETIFSLGPTSYDRYISNVLGLQIFQTHILHEVVKVSILHYDLSIREINKYIKHIKLIEKSLSGRDSFYKDATIAKYLFVPWALALRYKNTSLFIRFRNGVFTKDEFLSFFSKEPYIATWLSQSANKVKSEQSSEDIQVYLYNLYKYFFKSDSLKLYDDSGYENSEKFNIYNKSYLLTLIDF